MLASALAKILNLRAPAKIKKFFFFNNFMKIFWIHCFFRKSAYDHTTDDNFRNIWKQKILSFRSYRLYTKHFFWYLIDSRIFYKFYTF